MRSSVEIYNLNDRSISIVLQTDRLIEAPSFTPEGDSLIVNGDGQIYRVPVEPPSILDKIDTGFARSCNNDHGPSPDGKWLAITDKTEHGKACIYVLPLLGGEPKPVATVFKSYWHGWSPDSARITYCGIRDDVFDIYTVALSGADEHRLTDGVGHNDGPDYSHDGRWVYFNSDRDGQMQIWRVQADGAGLQKFHTSPFADWFPHPSPDGRYVLILSFDPAVGRDHPRDVPVCLRLITLETGSAETLTEMTGGQGTMNVPNWAPDSKSFAFIRYGALKL